MTTSDLERTLDDWAMAWTSKNIRRFADGAF